MTDEASLVLKVDATAVDKGTVSLEKLTAAGKKAETQTKQFTTATGEATSSQEKASASFRKMQEDMSKNAATLTKQKEATVELSLSTQRLLDKYDPLGTKLRSLESDFAALNKAASGGGIGAKNDFALDKAYAGLNSEIAKTKDLMRGAGVAADGSSASMQGLGLNTQYARRELMILGREAMTGNFSRMPQTFGSLVAHSNLLAFAMTGVGMAVIGSTAAVGLAAYAWYAWRVAVDTASASARAFEENAIKAAQAAESGVVKTSKEQLDDLQRKIDYAENNLAVALKKRRENRIRSKPETDALEMAVRARQQVITALERQVDQVQELDNKMQERLVKKHPAGNAFQAEQDAAKVWEQTMKSAMSIQEQFEDKAANLNSSQIKIKEYLESAAYAINEKSLPAMNALALSYLYAANAAEELARAKAQAGIFAAKNASEDAAEEKYMTEKLDAHERRLADSSKRVSEQFQKNVQKNIGDVLYLGLQGKFSSIADLFKQMLLRMTADAAAARLTRAVFGGAAGLASGAANAGAQSQLWAPSSGGNSSSGMLGLGVLGWVGIAVAAAAVIIQRSGYDRGNKSAEYIQSVQATGAVFGDISAKSATIAEVSKAIKLNSDESLVYSQGMLSALQQMTIGIDAFARAVIRVTPGAINGMGFGGRLGVTHDSSFNNPFMDDQGRGNWLPGAQKLTFISDMNKWGDDNDLVKNIIGKFSKKDISVTDAGLRLSGTVAQLSQGQGVQQYMDSNTTTSSWWGLKKTTDANPRRFAGVGAEFADQFAKIFSSLSDVLTKAGGALGRDTIAISSIIARFPVDISVSLYKLKGQALSDELSRVLTTLSDTLVKTIFGDVLKYAHVGEDALTTLARVANETEMMSKALDRLGVKVRPTTDALVGITQSLIDAAGGANIYFSQMDYFTKNFLTAAQLLVPVQNAVNKVFSDLGLAVPGSKDAFAALLKGLDLTTQQGQDLQVALLGIAPAFNSVATAAQGAKDKLMALIKTDSFKTMVDYQMFIARAAAGSTPAPAFAAGGDFLGGVRLVGEKGPELEATGASRITNTQSLMSALRNPQNNNAVLVAAVDSLRAEVARLRASSEATARSTEKTQSLLRNVTRDGQSLVTTAA